MNVNYKYSHEQFLQRKLILLVFVIIFIFSSTAVAENYYWVGGSGNWSDINHWAPLSGGSVIHSQTPTPDDDVFFDSNSFNALNQTVLINQKNAVCRNFDWTNVGNNPELVGHDTTSLRIYGNLILAENMIQHYHGEVVFESVTTGKTIITATHTFLNNVRFNGIGGGWQFLDDFSVEGNLYFMHGTLETNGHGLNCIDFVSLESNNRSISLSTSAIQLASWQIDGQNLTLQAIAATFNIETLLLNQNGNKLFYNDINFFGIMGNVINLNVFVSYHNINFDFDGSIAGNCNINNVTTNGNGLITDSDTINQVIFNGGGQIIGGHHVIGTFIANNYAVIEGNNEIGVALLYKESKILGTNIIDSAHFFKEGAVANSNQIRKLTITKHGLIEGTNNIADAILLNDANFKGNNNFDNLTLTAGNTYTFAIYNTQTIENELNIIGDCYKPIRMLSDTNGVQAIIKCNSIVNGNYLSLRDLKAEGSTPFHAANSVDLGNNSNWDIETTGGINLYWVNGQGDWSNPDHWDISSGGQGGHCPPTEIDNVTFDANSFSTPGQSVIVNVKNAVCYDMIWDNVLNPLFMGSDTNNLRVYGSLTLSPQMQWLFMGQTFFEATEKGKTIISAGNTFKNNNWFNGRGGGWSMIDDFETFRNIQFQQGEVYTLGNDVKCAVFSSTDTTTRKLFLSTSTVTMTDISREVWNFNANNLELHADSSLLISENLGGNIVSFGNHNLFYNNIEFYGGLSTLKNHVYCNYNLVTFFDSNGTVEFDCTIDTVIFHETKGTVLDSDTIKTAIFYKKDGFLKGGSHIVEIAYFYDNGRISGENEVDTALFYRNAIIDGANIIDTCIIFNKAIIEGENNIRTETILGDGEFIGENVFHDLTLSKSRSYYLENNKTQTVIDNLKIEGACTGPIIIQSDENQSQAIINKVNGLVEVNYVFLRDVKAEGSGIPFIANNSVDMGNNTNWTIHTSSPKELYWVGGNGCWSDSLHWSGSSGGTGGYCIPSPIDNVYFDENSFTNINDSVLIDIGNATCHNMAWDGVIDTPVFVSPDTNNLRIFGSLLFDNNMSLRIYGSTFFESTHLGNSINVNGNSFHDNVFFQGIGGQWLFSNNFTTDSTIFFSNGEIKTNGNIIECWAINSDFTNSRKLNFEQSTIIFNGNAIEVWLVNGVNMVISATESLIIVKKENAIMLTKFASSYVINNILAEGNLFRIYNIDSDIEFNNINFLESGQIHGNCKIDSVTFGGSGSIFDSDVINYVNVYGDFGIINGNHNIKIAGFWNNSSITGSNIFDSLVTFGASYLTGNNIINEFMRIGSTAIINGSNFAEKAILLGDGRFNGSNSFNVLTFSSGNKYELEEGITQIIYDEFNIRGNNCFPITLRSQSDGNEAFISIPLPKIVSGDFIEMRDINAIGGASFYAGNFSTDISNNSGWIFNNSPGYIFGFPGDTTMCDGHELSIGTENFNPDGNSTFLWQDGSTQSHFTVNNEDSLWVTVNYAYDCSYTDTIIINRRPSPDVDLGGNQTICEGESVYIFSSSDSLLFLWNDGSTDSTYVATTSSIVWLKGTAPNGCFSIDSIEVITKPKPIVFLGNDTTLRYDETLILDAGNRGATYLWSTGDTIQSITVSGSEEVVWADVIYDGCKGNDTILLNKFPRCIIAVPNAFSPNGDGQNDILFVRGNGFVEFELLIFNRVGEMIFKTNDESFGWDGTYKGEQQEVDVYMYILKGICADTQNVFYKGNITLLR